LPKNNLSLYIGFIFVCIGVGISIRARIDLGHNWAHAAEYQIKKDHELVTNGIYHAIRHPIYVGLLLALTGAALVAQSYTALIFFVIGGIGAYIQAKKEETILNDHFGSKYKTYMKKSYMFIPHVL
jgi:protein-S-isoprenylcysteine O-methyltransferase Ste14